MLNKKLEAVIKNDPTAIGNRAVFRGALLDEIGAESVSKGVLRFLFIALYETDSLDRIKLDFEKGENFACAYIIKRLEQEGAGEKTAKEVAELLFYIAELQTGKKTSEIKTDKTNTETPKISYFTIFGLVLFSLVLTLFAYGIFLSAYNYNEYFEILNRLKTEEILNLVTVVTVAPRYLQILHETSASPFGILAAFGFFITFFIPFLILALFLTGFSRLKFIKSYKIKIIFASVIYCSAIWNIIILLPLNGAFAPVFAETEALARYQLFLNYYIICFACLCVFRLARFLAAFQLENPEAIKKINAWLGAAFIFLLHFNMLSFSAINWVWLANGLALWVVWFLITPRRKN